MKDISFGALAYFSLSLSWAAFFLDVSMAQLVASMSGVVLGGVAKVVGLNLARGKYLQHLLFTMTF